MVSALIKAILYSEWIMNRLEFRYAFSDEEIAKSVVSRELLSLIYPYGYILSNEEVKEWNSFVEEYEKRH